MIRIGSMNYLIAFAFFSFLAQNAYGYQTICYDDLGCFAEGPPYGDTSQRPGTHLPRDPSKINAEFFLDTQTEFGREVFNRNMDDLTQTSFDPLKETKIIIHGFLHNGDVVWMHEMSNALLSVGDFNVIRVGWREGSVTLDYPQAATDTQVVGAETGLFIQNIVNNLGGDYKKFHCIGHSLGAQTCGYVGKFVSTKIARITGLDPAGPYFENTPVEVRLDPSDADFVDVIHSDAEKLLDLGFGTAQVSGHIDFWPNDGIQQPGCDQNALSTIVGLNGIAEGVQNFVACNHLRAIHFFTESITTKCPFSSVACSSYEEYVNGKCLNCPNGACVSMGYRSIDSAEAIYQSTNPNHYLMTTRMSPYCEQTAYVQITLGTRGDSIDGKLYISLYSLRSNTEQELIGGEDQELPLRPSTTFSYMTQYQSIPSGLNRVKLLWTQEEFSLLNQFITVAQINVWFESEQKMFSFCGDGTTELKQEQRYSFYAC